MQAEAKERIPGTVEDTPAPYSSLWTRSLPVGLISALLRHNHSHDHLAVGLNCNLTSVLGFVGKKVISMAPVQKATNSRLGAQKPSWMVCISKISMGSISRDRNRQSNRKTPHQYVPSTSQMKRKNNFCSRLSGVTAPCAPTAWPRWAPCRASRRRPTSRACRSAHQRTTPFQSESCQLQCRG